MSDPIGRPLPEQRNHLLSEDKAPKHEILVERRCLGQTELKVRAGQVGTSNATKPNNLGTLDYAHLRVPLPKDLTGSGIFSKGSNRKFPDAYFLMRRSSDGYISATGMFKAAFPYAMSEEETAEKKHLKSLSTTSSEEVAGNVWIHPDAALTLAEEYGLRLWIAALLDPEPITKGTSDPSVTIQSPPTYKMKPSQTNGTELSPEKKAPATDSKRSARARSVRSESPTASKKTPARKMATPRKPRKGRGTALASVDEDSASVEPSESVNGDANDQLEENHHDTVRVEVETDVKSDGDDDTETTRVKVEMPTGHPDLPLPEDPQQMLETARAMVREAEKVGGATSSKGKRKAADMVEADDEVGLDGPAASSKRARKITVELRKEKIRRRALTGIAAGLALGALVPSILAAFGA